MPDTEITLQSLVRIFTRRWRWVLGVSLLVMVVVYLATVILLEDIYTVSVKLVVSKSKVGEKTMPIDYTMLEPDTYVHLLKSRDGLTQAMEAFALGEPPYEYRLMDFVDCVEVRQLRNTDVLELQVTLPEPVTSKEVADFLAQWAIERNLELLKEESKQSRSLFEDEVQAAHDYLIRSASNLSRFMEQSQTAASEEYVKSAQDALWNIKQDRSFNASLRDESKARMEILAKIVAELPEKEVLDRTISSEQEMQDLLEQMSPAARVEDLLRIQMKNESFSLSHFEARKAWIKASEDYYGAIAHVASMDVEIKRLEAEIKQAEQELAIKQALQGELEAAAAAFEEVAGRDVEAKTTIASERQNLTVIDRAVVPKRPSGPNRPLIALSAGLFAFLLALFVSLAMDLRTVMEPSRPVSS